MEIETLTKDDLEIVRGICLDPSVDSETRDLMENSMDERITWIKRMMIKGLKIIMAFEAPRQERLHYKWVGKMFHSDLGIKGKVPMGLLEYVPIEHALEPINGTNSLFINCMWILPPFWSKGTGEALLKEFIEKAKTCGSGSVIAYDGDKWFGTSINYMPDTFFKKFGFREVDRDDTRVLLEIDLGSVKSPKFIFPKTNEVNNSEILNLDIFFNYQCPWARYMINTIKNGVKNYSNIRINCINTDSVDVVKRQGISRGIHLNGKLISTRMTSWEEIKPKMLKFLKKK